MAIGQAGIVGTSHLLLHYQKPTGAPVPPATEQQRQGECNRRLRDWRVIDASSEKGPVAARLVRQSRVTAEQYRAEPDKPFRYRASLSNVGSFLGNSRDGEYQIGIASLRGWRPHMEDAHCAVEFEVTIQGKTYPIQLYGVFDGHSGQDVASCVAANFAHYITQALLEENKNGLSDQGIWNALKMSMVRLNNDLPRLFSSEEGQKKASVLTGELKRRAHAQVSR